MIFLMYKQFHFHGIIVELTDTDFMMDKRLVLILHLVSLLSLTSTVGCKKKSPFRPRRTGVARLDRYRFHTVPRAFNFLHRLTSSVARLFNVHEETVRSIAMYVRR